MRFLALNRQGPRARAGPIVVCYRIVDPIDLTTMSVPDPITIIGTGLLGTSLAAALRARGFAGRITGLAHQQSTAERAHATGFYNAVTTDPTDVIPDAAMIVVAVPLSGFGDVFDLIAAHARPDAIVTDVGSTKLGPLTDARTRLPKPARFVGAHPMAGKEQAGPDAADAELFIGKPCIVCPESDTDPDAAAAVEELWQYVGMQILRMTADEHDRQTALTSHLPHAVSSLLALVAAEQGGWDVASTGFASTTRLASSNPTDAHRYHAGQPRETQPGDLGFPESSQQSEQRTERERSRPTAGHAGSSQNRS